MICPPRDHFRRVTGLHALAVHIHHRSDRRIGDLVRRDGQGPVGQRCRNFYLWSIGQQGSEFLAHTIDDAIARVVESVIFADVLNGFPITTPNPFPSQSWSNLGGS